MILTNEYFDGTVKSLAYTSAAGKSTVGVMEDGSYEIGTSSHEIMTVIEGTLQILLPQENKWQKFVAGETFEVGANQVFKVISIGQTSYLCQYR